MITGSRVWIRYQDKEAKGWVVLGSDNRRSLAVELDEGGIWIKNTYCMLLILTETGRGEYEEMSTHETLKLEWIFDNQLIQ